MVRSGICAVGILVGLAKVTSDGLSDVAIGVVRMKVAATMLQFVLLMK